jgi:putative ABC transport system permease protein
MRKINLKVWRDIGRQRLQFAALVLIILLGVASYGGMTGMIDDVERSIQRTFRELQFQDLGFTFDSPIADSMTQQVSQLPNVQAALGRFVVDTGLYVSADNQVHARLVGMPTAGPPQVNELYIKEGRYLQEGDGLAAVLEHHFAEYYGYGPGAVLHPIVNGRQVDVRVVGVGVSPEYLMAVASRENSLPSPSGFAVLFMPLQQLQQMFGADQAINDLVVVLNHDSAASMDKVIGLIQGAVGDAGIRAVAKRPDNPSYNLLMLDLEGARAMVQAVPLMLLLIAALSIYVFLNRMLQAQVPQVGVIKAMGYSKWALTRHYLLFSGCIALAGSLLGLALSYPIGKLFTEAYAAEFGLPFVAAQFHPAAAVEAIAITLLICVAAGLSPARTAARMPPAQAMHFDPAATLVKGSVPLVERLLTPAIHLGITTKTVLRNLFRNRRRTLTTALGFVFALIVLLACWALYDGMDHMLQVQFEQTDRWDLRATFAQIEPHSVLDEVKSWPGVKAAEVTIELPVTMESETGRKYAVLTAIAPDASLHGFQLPRGRTSQEVLVPGHVLISAAVGEELQVQTGDSITLQTPLGSQSVIVDTSNREVMNAGIYAELPWVQEVAGGLTGLNGLLLQVEGPRQRDVRKMLYELPGVSAVDFKEEIAFGWQSLMGIYYLMMGMFLVFALIIAGAVMFNTATVNVLEREREIATMRALGQNRRRLWRMLISEDLLIGLISLLPGLMLARVVTYYLFQVFNTSADFYLPFYISPHSYAVVTLVIFGAALPAQTLAMRRVGRISLAEATKIIT